MSNERIEHHVHVPPPPTDRLQGPTFQWDRGPIRHLWSAASPAPSSSHFNLGEHPRGDAHIFETAQSDLLKNKVSILHAPFLCGFDDWESGILASARLDREGEVTDAWKRGETYESGEEYKPEMCTVDDSLTREGIWELDVESEMPVGTISQLRHLWPQDELIAAHSGTKISKAQYWTNIRLGLGGTCSKTIPYATVHRVVYGTQYVFWNDYDWITQAPSSSSMHSRTSPPRSPRSPKSPKRRKTSPLEDVPDESREKRYTEVCGHMANYTYAQMKGWKYAVLKKGDAIVVPPTVPIGILSATDCSTTYHSYALTSHLPLIEAAFHASEDISLNPLDIRPSLVDWLTSRTTEQSAHHTSTMPIESRRSLLRLLAYEADNKPDRFVRSNATYYWWETSETSRYLTDNSSMEGVEDTSSHRERILIKDVSQTKLDLATRGKLFALVPPVLRIGQDWKFFGWGDAELEGVESPGMLIEELNVPGKVQERLKLDSPQAKFLWISKRKLDMKLMARM